MKFIQSIVDISMTPEQLYKTAFAFERVEAPQIGVLVTASLWRVGDRFVMFGVSGEHWLSVAATDAERLYAHWQGFKQTASAVAVRRLNVTVSK